MNFRHCIGKKKKRDFHNVEEEGSVFNGPARRSRHLAAESRTGVNKNTAVRLIGCSNPMTDQLFLVDFGSFRRRLRKGSAN